MDLALKPIRFSSYLGLIRQNRNFRRLWIAQIVSEIGDCFYSLAVYSLFLESTGQAGSVAFALVLQVLPQTLIGPTAGMVNDRVPRKRVMIAADLGRMLVVLVMLLAQFRSMIWLVCPLLLAETTMAAFFEPARSSVIPNIAAPEDLIVANTLSTITWSVNLVLGAILGGVIAAVLGRNAVFVLNALSFLASALLIRGMKFEEPHAESAPPLRVRDLVDYSPVVEGARYIRRDFRLMATVFVKAGLLVMGPSWVVFTVMANRDFAAHWHGLDPQCGGTVGMSLLLGARGLGALLGPLFSARWAGHADARLRLGILVAFAAQALGYAALGGANVLWLACLCIALAHCGDSTAWVFSTTLLQLNTEVQVRGRVFAADLGFSSITIALGTYLAGLFLDRGVSAHAVAEATGMLMLIPTAAWGCAMKFLKPRPCLAVA